MFEQPDPTNLEGNRKEIAGKKEFVSTTRKNKGSLFKPRWFKPWFRNLAGRSAGFITPAGTEATREGCVYVCISCFSVFEGTFGVVLRANQRDNHMFVGRTPILIHTHVESWHEEVRLICRIPGKDGAMFSNILVPSIWNKRARAQNTLCQPHVATARFSGG